MDHPQEGTEAVDDLKNFCEKELNQVAKEEETDRFQPLPISEQTMSEEQSRPQSLLGSPKGVHVEDVAERQDMASRSDDLQDDEPIMDELNLNTANGSPILVKFNKFDIINTQSQLADSLSASPKHSSENGVDGDRTQNALDVDNLCPGLRRALELRDRLDTSRRIEQTYAQVVLDDEPQQFGVVQRISNEDDAVSRQQESEQE